MKRISKILAIVMALVLLVATFALIASASDATFTVNGAASEATTLSAAITEAGDGGTVKLNKGIKVDSTVNVTSKVEIDLNSHTITLTTTDKTALFSLSNGSELSIVGEGDLTANRLITANAGSKFELNGLGSGIKLYSKDGIDAFILVNPGARAEFSGDIIYTPTLLGGRFIQLGAQKANLNQIVNSYASFDAARLTVNEPSNDSRYSLTSAIYFAYVYEGAQLTIKNNSVINMVHGHMFNVACADVTNNQSYADEYYTGAGAGGAYATEINEAPKELTIRIDVDDSKLYANNSGYSVLYHNTNAGTFLVGAYKAIYMTMDNVDFVSCNRTIAGISSRGTYNVAAGKIEFKNVNYKSSEGVSYLSSWLISEKVNIIWDGGTVDLKTAAVTSVGSIPKTEDGDPFGAAAKTAFKAAHGIDISPETHRVVMYTGGNNNAMPVLDTWTYYKLSTKGTNQVAINGIGYAEYVLKDDGSGYRLAEEGETPDTWFGTKISNLAFVTAPTEPATAVGANGTACYTIEGEKITSPTIYTGLLEKTTYAVGYFTDGYLGVDNTYGDYTDVFNPTTSYQATFDPINDGKAITITGTKSSSAYVASVRDFGTLEEVVGETGKNGYLKWSVGEAEDDTADDASTSATEGANPYVEFKTMTYPNSPSVSYKDGVLTVNGENSTMYALEDYKYIIQEFDVTTDVGLYPLIGSTIITRAGIINYKNGAFSGGIDQKQNNINPTKFTGNGLVTSAAAAGVTVKTASQGYQLPTDGTWSRLTFIFEIKGWGAAGTYTIGDLTRSQSTLDVTVHAYINGVWRASFSDFMKPVDTELKSTLVLDVIRFNPSCILNSSICFDNMRVSYYKADDAACADIAKVTANPTATIVDNPHISIMPDNNTYYDATAVGKVDGVEYKDEKSLINAIEPGSVIELSEDISTVLNVSSNNKIILNGNKYAGYFSETHVGRQYESAVSFLAAKPTEIVTLHFDSSEFGIDDSTHKATLGSTLYLLVAADAPIYNEGLMKTLVGWQTAGGNSVVTEADVVGGTVEIVPITSDVNYYYTVTVDGNTAYYFENEVQNMVANVNAVLIEGKTVVVVLWSDIDTAPGASYSMAKNSSLYFDLNGHKYMKTSGGNGFRAASGTHLYLYSSREGGAFVNAQSVVGETTVRVTGLPIWYTDWNEKEEHPGMHATFGAVKNEELGIDADGANLTVIASMIADVRCKEIAQATQANGFTDVNGDGKVDVNDIKERATLTIDGGNYIRFTMGGWAMFAACGPLDVNISQANIIGVGSIFSTHSTYHATSMNLNVDNSRVIATSNKFDGTGLEKVFNQFTADSTASFTNTVIAGKLTPNGGTVTLGAGVALANPDQISASYVKLADGLVMAKANYNVTTSTPINYVTYSFTVGGEPQNYDFRDTWGNTTVDGTVSGAVFNKELSVWTTYTDTRNIAGYIDSPEKLATIKWYDTDETTVLGESYHVPHGDISFEGAPESEVSGLASGNGWYTVEFDHWNVPDELSVGEISAYAVLAEKKANVETLKINVTVYTYFQLNFYLPAEVDIDGFELVGIAKDSAGTQILPSASDYIGEEEYIRFYDNPGAANADETVRYIIFKIDGEIVVSEFKFGIPTYAAYVLQGEYSDTAKALVSNMVRYANSCYKMINDETNELYDALLDSFAVGLIDYSGIVFTEAETDVDWSGLSPYISGASFMFGAYQPRFVFEYASSESVVLPIDAYGNIGEWPEGNRGLFAHIYFENARGDVLEHTADNVAIDGGVDKTELAVNEGTWEHAGTVYAMSDGIFVYDIRNVINVTVYDTDGVAHSGTYSFAAYINSLTEGTDAYNAAMSLYAFSISAAAYKAG